MNGISRYTFTRSDYFIESVTLSKSLRNQFGLVLWRLDAFGLERYLHMFQNESFVECNCLVFVIIEDHVVVEVDGRRHVGPKLKTDVPDR
ncbi:hypothetical protein WL73_21705 [Burkholderia ubonensis]|uniref:DUF559 domain-containing protein n=1 Tax=Burkholderia ubonensis TaxID=101571 RepID=A0A107FP67_9BURK|nr:hypothetical protein WL73_21705 [Burkholderia ubonensis]